MPRAGQSFSPEDARKRGLIPGSPVARAVERWCIENDSSITNLEEISGISEGLLLKICSGVRDWIEFDVADKVITFMDPWLWLSDQDLSDIYQGFDFTRLDLMRPTSPEADELPLLDGLSHVTAGVVFGVEPDTIGKLRRRAAA